MVRKERKVSKLKKSSFAVLFLFTLAPTIIESQNKPVSYGILFDNTGSMARLLPLQREVANLIITRKVGTKFSIYGFGTVPENSNLSAFAVGTECSADVPSLAKQIEQLGVVRGQTTLLDAVQAGVVRLARPSGPQCSASDEQVLIVMSDGEDRASSIGPDEVVSTIKATGVKVYIIGLTMNLSDETGFISKSPMKRASAILIGLAKNTGGRVVFPAKKETAEEIVTKLFDPDYSFPK